MTLAAGTHELVLRSAGGEQLATASFAIAQGARRTAVISGSTTANAALSVTSDTMSTNAGGGYRSIIGSILMVNSAPGVGPFSIVVHQVGSDSVYHFGNFGFGAGSLPPPAPLRVLHSVCPGHLRHRHHQSGQRDVPRDHPADAGDR